MRMSNKSRHGDETGWALERAAEWVSECLRGCEGHFILGSLWKHLGLSRPCLSLYSLLVQSCIWIISNAKEQGWRLNLAASVNYFGYGTAKDWLVGLNHHPLVMHPDNWNTMNCAKMWFCWNQPVGGKLSGKIANQQSEWNNNNNYNNNKPQQPIFVVQTLCTS